MNNNTENTQQRRFTAFTQELAALSKKYGIVLSSCGGVDITDPTDEALKKLTYTDDVTSGDLSPRNWDDQDDEA